MGVIRTNSNVDNFGNNTAGNYLAIHKNALLVQKQVDGSFCIKAVVGCWVSKALRDSGSSSMNTLNVCVSLSSGDYLDNNSSYFYGKIYDQLKADLPDDTFTDDI